MKVPLKGKEFEPHPATDQFIRAVCVDVTPPTINSTFGTPREVIRIVFQTEMVMEDGKLWLLSTPPMTVSLNKTPPSNLRKFLEKAFGGPIEKYGDDAEEFELEDLVGETFEVMVEQTEGQDGRHWAIPSIIRPLGKKQAPLKPDGSYTRIQDRATQAQANKFGTRAAAKKAAGKAAAKKVGRPRTEPVEDDDDIDRTPEPAPRAAKSASQKVSPQCIKALAVRVHVAKNKGWAGNTLGALIDKDPDMVQSMMDKWIPKFQGNQVLGEASDQDKELAAALQCLANEHPHGFEWDYGDQPIVQEPEEVEEEEETEDDDWE